MGIGRGSRDPRNTFPCERPPKEFRVLPNRQHGQEYLTIVVRPDLKRESVVVPLHNGLLRDSALPTSSDSGSDGLGQRAGRAGGEAMDDQ